MRGIATLVFMTAVTVGWQQQSQRQPPVLPRSGEVPRDTAREQRLLSAIRAAEGFDVSLFAGPPVAMYPTCLASGPDGALFVCVDPNLSLDAQKGRGKIVRLNDSNGDGAADRYTVFAEMDSPRGVVHDGRTLYVMHPPLLSAYRDTNNDGIADTSEVLVRGLGFDLDFRGADHTTNGITLGIDGWIYVAVGDYGYQNAVGRDGGTIRHRGGSVVRVRTDGTGLEIYAIGTRNIYDVALDPFLNVFSRDNTNDGDGWDTRLHFIAPNANMGYPALYRNFADEHMPPLHDYGGGAGTGGLWVHDPAFPDGYGNTLYTGDWTVNRVFLHPMTPNGATFSVEQREFLTIPHPSDMVMDGRGNMYVASLFAGNFTYQGDSVGYVVRVRPRAATTQNAPSYMSASPQQLLELLVSGNAEHRLYAQRELLRKGDQGNVADRLQQILADRNRPAFARVAAMFTLKQLRGQRSHSAITAVASDPALRAASLRALTDHRGQMAGVSANFIAPFLRDTSAQVRLAAIAALVRLGGTASARDIVPLTADPDPALSHAAVRALVTLNARQSALAAVDSGSMPMIRGALRALQQMHDPMVVTALLSRARSAPPPASAEITFALARLYHREANWTGDWWGTRPAFAGPYFAPVTWEQSGNIRGALRAALLVQGQSAASLDATLDQFVRNRVLPPGSRALLSRLASANDPRRSEVVGLLVGTFQVSPTAAPLLTALDATGSAMRSAVAELLGAEASLDSAYVPLIRVAALDTTLDAAVRAQLLGQAGRLPGRPGLEVAAELFASANPDSGVAAPIDMAWRRFVGDRRRVQELDYFIEMARAPESSRRTLAFSVLLQTIRGNRVQQNVRARVTPVIDSTWSDRTRAADLVHAIVLMRLESQYADQLAAYRGGGGSGGTGVTQAARPPATGSPDWLQLFNGRDLSDWEMKFAGRPLNENFNNTFRVEEGMLKVRYDQWTGFNGEFGHIFYKQPFSHYIVAVEYRFVGEQVTGAGQSNSWAIRNNGIMLHSQSAASMGERQDFPISLEVQLLGGLGRGPRTTGNLCTPGTHVVRNDRLVTTHCMNSSSQTYDGDQWVRVEAMVLGDSLIRHIVNGDTVFTYSKPQMGGGSANNTNPGVLVTGKPLTEGFISLQAETAPIDFRKVELLNLAGCTDPASPNYRPYFVRSDPTACRPR